MRDHRFLSAVLLLVVCTLLAATAAHAVPNGAAVGAPAPAAACAADSTLTWDPALLSTPQPLATGAKADLPEILFPAFCPPRCLGCTAAECRAGHCVVQSGCIVCC